MKRTINDVTYYYEWFSGYQPERPTIVFLHGFTGTSQTFSYSARSPLSEAYNLLAIDLLGHGQSAIFVHPYRYQMVSLCEDLIALTETIGVSSFSLIGYSMGARVALALSCLFPQKIDQLLLESGSPGLEETAAKQIRKRSDQQLACLLITKGIQPFVDHWENADLFATQKRLPESVRAKIREERLSQHPFGLACSLWYMGTGVQPDFWSALSKIQLAIVIVVGEYDNKFVDIANRMKHYHPTKITLQIIQGAGHCVHIEKPTVFFSVLEEVFLKEENKC